MQQHINTYATTHKNIADDDIIPLGIISSIHKNKNESLSIAQKQNQKINTDLLVKSKVYPRTYANTHINTSHTLDKFCFFVSRPLLC